MNKVSLLLSQSKNITDRKLAKELRFAVLEELTKLAESVIEPTTGGTLKSNTFPRVKVMRGGTIEQDKLYGLQPEKVKSEIDFVPAPRTLSTRYSPDHVGVQVRRIGDGIFQDPITNKIYNWNEGFTTDDNEVFPGSNISLQTDLIFEE